MQTGLKTSVAVAAVSRECFASYACQDARAEPGEGQLNNLDEEVVAVGLNRLTKVNDGVLAAACFSDETKSRIASTARQTKCGIESFLEFFRR